jgi:hypothetical protein
MKDKSKSNISFLSKICVLSSFVSFQFIYIHHYQTITHIKEKTSMPAVVKHDNKIPFTFLLAKNNRH